LNDIVEGFIRFDTFEKTLILKKLARIIVVSVLIIFSAFFLWIVVPNRILDQDEVKAKYLTGASKFYDWNGLRVHYTEEGTGMPVLMIHGYGGSFRNFSYLAEEMKDEYRVIRIDLPGFGLSDAPKGYDNGEDIVEMYRNFTQAFIPDVVGDSFYVFGNSMGGWMAWEIAIEMPEKIKGMVLLCAAGYEMEEVVETVVPLLRLRPVRYLLSRGMPMAYSKSKLKILFADPAKIRPGSAISSNEMTNKEGTLLWMLKMAASGQAPDTSQIASVQVPTLIIWGEKDRLIPFNHAFRFERDIKGSKRIIYPDAGHLPMVEHPERVYADFRRYFNLTGS